MNKPEFKFQVVQKRFFLEGSLKGMTIEHKSVRYETEQAALDYAQHCVGLTVGGGHLGPECRIEAAWVVEAA